MDGFSGGMRHRLGIAVSLLTLSDYLLPLTGTLLAADVLLGPSVAALVHGRRDPWERTPRSRAGIPGNPSQERTMNWVHVHLLLNHVPIIGSLTVILLLAWGVARRSEEVVRVGFTFAVLVALITLVVYFTGEPAEETVERLPGVSETFLDRHEEAGRLTMFGIEAFGLLSLAGLAAFRRRPIPRGIAALMLVLAFVPAGAAAWTANLGGNIRHSEIRSSPAGGEPAAEMPAETEPAGTSESDAPVP